MVLPRQRLICRFVDIQLIHRLAGTAFFCRHVRFAEVLGVDGRAAVDDLRDDALADTADLGSAVPAPIGHFVASSAVAFRALGRPVPGHWGLSTAQTHVDAAGAFATGDLG